MIRRIYRTLTVVVPVVMLVFALGIAPGIVAAQDDGVPDPPAAYYGDVTVNGDAAPVGTEITAVVTGDSKGSIVVEEPGEFGGSEAFDEKLVVSDADPGDEVTFVVNGVEAEETVTWESGDVQEVSLTFEDVPEDSDEDSSDETNGDDSGGTGSSGGQAGGGQAGGGTTENTTESSEDSGSENETLSEPTQEATANITADSESNTAKASFSEGTAVNEIEFDNTESTGQVNVVERDRAPEDTGQAPGTEVVVSEITVPDEMENSDATIRVQISSDRLESIEASAEELRIYRFTDDEWTGLETEATTGDEGGAVLEAETPGFSYFSVSAVSEPDAIVEIEPEAIESGESVTLDGSSSESTHGNISSYSWTVDDREFTGKTVELSLDEPGEYSVELIVTNEGGEQDTATETVSVSESQQKTATTTPTTSETDNSAVTTTEVTEGNSDERNEEVAGIPWTWGLIPLGAVLLITSIVIVRYRRTDSAERL